MLNSLRGRFILSHILPLLVILPIIGLSLIYLLESQVVLRSLSEEVLSEALLASEMAGSRTDIWVDRSQAQALVVLIHTHSGARVMLVSGAGSLLMSSDPDDWDQLDHPLSMEGAVSALGGQRSVSQTYSARLHDEIVDVWVPVVDGTQRVIGALRLSHNLGTVYSRFLRLRYVVLGSVVVGLVLSALVGWSLAANLERPLSEVTRAIHQLVGGERLAPLPEEGPHELRLLAHSVNTLVERLHTLEDTRSRLLANLVHELGRPLGALRSAIQALLGGADRDENLRQELLIGMDREVGLLRHLLDDLVGLHDRVIGSLELDPQETDVKAWLVPILAPWREAALAKGLIWEADIPAELPALVVDPERLEQALGNLLSNAVKFTPSGGVVSVGAGVQSDDLWLQVSDSGPGIAEEDRRHIFEPLYRKQASRRFAQGMGLGLSIAHDLVAAHGGHIEVESAPGLGSHFTVHLPLKR
jgi:two-component system sensor histidine kinase BaeS